MVPTGIVLGIPDLRPPPTPYMGRSYPYIVARAKSDKTVRYGEQVHEETSQKLTYLASSMHFELNDATRTILYS